MKIRSGTTLWELEDALPAPPASGAPLPLRCDALIIGAGVTGAFLAERLAREGRSVVIIDRRGPQRAATAASTALVLWETDQPLLALEQRIGFDRAARVLQRGRDAITEIAQRVRGTPAHMQVCDSLYLAGDLLDAVSLREEQVIRAHAGLLSDWQSREEIFARDGVVADAALRSPGAASLDSVALTRVLIGQAISRGAHYADQESAIELEPGTLEVAVRLESGAVVRADAVILATGYEMPPFISVAGHAINSTWVIATEPTPAWKDGIVLWEASESYAYLRAANGRIIMGGADEERIDAEARDALTPAKRQALEAKLSELLPSAANVDIALTWTGFFGATDDSLPLIGPITGMPRVFAAYGYGGNGITFSCIAADALANLIAGRGDADAETFNPERFA